MTSSHSPLAAIGTLLVHCLHLQHPNVVNTSIYQTVILQTKFDFAATISNFTSEQ